MNSDPREFEALRRIMALKRHEQPPPGYLGQLPGRIRARIERGEGQLNVWDRLSANFSLRPTLAYAFGLTVCGALGLSAISMVREEMARAADPSPGVIVKGPAPAGQFAVQFKPEPPTLHVANWLGNTNPTADTEPQLSLFDMHHAVVPVSYQSGN